MSFSDLAYILCAALGNTQECSVGYGLWSMYLLYDSTRHYRLIGWGTLVVVGVLSDTRCFWLCGINMLASNMSISAHLQGPELSIQWQRIYPYICEGREETGLLHCCSSVGLASVVSPCIVFSPATHARRCNPAQAQCLLAATQARRGLSAVSFIFSSWHHHSIDPLPSVRGS